MTSSINVGFMLLKFGLIPALGLAIIHPAIRCWRLRRSGAGPTPAEAPLGSSTSKRAETIAVAALGGGLLLLLATSPRIGGQLFELADKPRPVIIASVAAFAVALLGLVAAAILACRGAGSAAVVVASATLIAYGFALNGDNSISRIIQPRQDFMPRLSLPTRRKADDIDFTFDISGQNVVGARIWVNDVDLGVTPVEMKLSDFLEKVPSWKLPPGPLERGTTNIPADHHLGYPRFPFAGAFQFYELPAQLAKSIDQRQGSYLYVRVEYDGEQGVRTGSSGASGGTGDYGIGVGFRFPERDAALERLLDQARVADYHFDDAWIKKVEQFGDDGWIALRQAAADETMFAVAFDRLVDLRYDLHGPAPADDPWSTFHRIADEADAAGVYLTATPAGRAIERLSPRLSPKELVDAAVARVDVVRNVSYSQHNDLFGATHFAVADEGARLPKLPTENSFGTGFSWGDARLRPSDGALAHAVWLTLNRLESADPDRANAFRDRLVAALLTPSLGNPSDQAMGFALRIGSPAIEKYLLRQVEWTRERNPETDYSLRAPGPYDAPISKWIYWAAGLRSPVGLQVRREYKEKLFHLADEVSKHPMPSAGLDAIEFLFTENELGEESIGVEYWPRFQEQLRRGNPGDVFAEKAFAYLRRLEPWTPVDLYIAAVKEAWNADSSALSLQNLLNNDPSAIPPEKRIAILDALIAELPEWIAAHADQGPVPWAEQMLEQKRYEQMDDPAAVEFQLARLRANDDPAHLTKEDRRDWLSRQLKESAIGHPKLLAALAAAPEPEIRKIAVEPLRNHPTPDNRKVLAKLTDDADPAVRNAARAATKALDELRASMP